MRTPSIISFIGFMFTTMAMALDQDKGSKSQDAERAQVAITYLKRLSKGELDLTEHTALSRHCGPKRFNELRAHIEFLRKNGFRENDSLSIETQKTDTNLAGVLIRANNPATPFNPRVHAIALIRKKEVWLPAPLPGSFSNTGYGYGDKIEQSVRMLEHWMAGEKVLRESQYRNKASSSIKSKLLSMEKEAGFDKMSPEQATTFFLEQFRNKHLLGIITSMGGASDALADHLDATMNLITTGMNNKENSDSDWFLLTNRAVIAQILRFDKKNSEIAVGFYNPMKNLQRKSFKVIHFPIHNTEGKTFIHLPPLFHIALLSEEDRKNFKKKGMHAPLRQRHDQNALLNKIPAAIFNNLKTVSHVTPDKLLDHLLDSLKKNDFMSFLSLVPRDDDLFNSEQNQKTILSDHSSFWRNIRELNLIPRQEHHILVEKNLALAPLLYQKINRAGEFKTIKVWMLRDNEGWHLISPGILQQSVNDKQKPSTDKLEKMLPDFEEKHQDESARNFLRNTVTITPPLNLGAPTEKDASHVFANFRNHLRAKDTQTALSCCAILKGGSKTQALKVLSYARRGIADHTDHDHILDTIQKGNWLGISVRTESTLAGTNDYPLYLVANTAKGARIMIDIDLRHASNKGRELLNTENWNLLEQILPKESIDALKAIFEQHIKLSNKDIEKVSQTQD